MTNYNYGGGNPMRPHRVRLTTGLVDGYGLTDKMQIMRPRSRSKEEIMLFHADGEQAAPRGAGRRPALVVPAPSGAAPFCFCCCTRGGSLVQSVQPTHRLTPCTRPSPPLLAVRQTTWTF